MSETLAPPIAAAMLLVALEPSAPRGRIEAAVTLLGHRADAVGEATTRGLVQISGERLEVVDARVARLVTQAATDRELRLAHLALACSRARRTIGYDARSVFDALSGALDGSVPLPLAPETGGSEVTNARDPLTPREQKVAELAASGLPTREIAAASYLSQKTVEYHLTRVYRKLGVRSKSELVFALAGSPVLAGR
jgi:DNA-binding CsgD family transcriptional regulator